MNSMASAERTELETVLLAAASFLEKHRRVDLALKIKVDEESDESEPAKRLKRSVHASPEYDHDEYPLPAGLA